MRWSQLQPALFERTADGLAFPSKVEPIVWTIPGTDAKNGLAHEVPLSGAVMDLLRDLATRDEAERLRINSTSRVKRNQTARPVSEYVFPSRKTDGPYLEIQKAVERLRKRSGFGFTAHDLRRTAATLMADAGVPENIIPTILDHTEPGVTRRHYNLHAYRSEKRAALETWARYAENMRLDAQLRLCHNQSMDLQVFAPAELTSEAKRFLAPFEVNSIVSPMRAIQDEPLRGDRFLLYLSGREDEDQLTKPLKSFARVKRRLLMVVLYARQADHRNVVLWARAAERALPDHTEFCFSVTEVARALKLRPRTRAATRQSPDGRRIDIDALRTALGLTQAQLAVAIGVSERTVQNWEAGRVSPQAERRLRDLIELNETLDRYIDPEQRQSWLISPNDASAGNAPRDWIIEGRPRDLLWEFRRMQVGEPV